MATFLLTHWLLLLLVVMVAFAAFARVIHIWAPNSPRLVAFVQAVLPGDSPKMWAAIMDRLPPADRAIAQAVVIAETLFEGSPEKQESKGSTP